MNDKQRNVLIGIAVVVVLMLMVPPYVIKGYGSSSNAVINSGYSLIFDLPDRATVDVVTLLAQWVGVCIAGAIGFLITKNK